MAAKVPVKAIFTGSDVTSLGEFGSSDTINGSYITDDTIDEANLKVSNNPFFMSTGSFFCRTDFIFLLLTI